MYIIKKSTNNKCWRGCGEKGTFLHCWWKCKLVQPLQKTIWKFLQFSSIQSLSRVRLFATPWITAHQASLSITNSWSPLKFMSIESVMPSSHFILIVPFSSCPQSLRASGSFPVSQLFTWGGQSIEVQLQHQSFQWTPRTDLL